MGVQVPLRAPKYSIKSTIYAHKSLSLGRGCFVSRTPWCRFWCRFVPHLTPRAAEIAGTAVLRIVVSNDSMKKATATSHGKSRLEAAEVLLEGSDCFVVTIPGCSSIGGQGPSRPEPLRWREITTLKSSDDVFEVRVGTLCLNTGDRCRSPTTVSSRLPRRPE